MGLINKIIQIVGTKILKGKAEKPMGELMAKLSGYKTYITLILGIVVAVAGHFWGPIDLPGPADIPYMDAKTMWEAIWMGLTGVFMRAGIAKSGPTPPAP